MYRMRSQMHICKVKCRKLISWSIYQITNQIWTTALFFWQIQDKKASCVMLCRKSSFLVRILNKKVLSQLSSSRILDISLGPSGHILDRNTRLLPVECNREVSLCRNRTADTFVVAFPWQKFLSTIRLKNILGDLDLLLSGVLLEL